MMSYSCHKAWARLLDWVRSSSAPNEVLPHSLCEVVFDEAWTDLASREFVHPLHPRLQLALLDITTALPTWPVNLSRWLGVGWPTAAVRFGAGAATESCQVDLFKLGLFAGLGLVHSPGFRRLQGGRRYVLRGGALPPLLRLGGQPLLAVRREPAVPLPRR